MCIDLTIFYPACGHRGDLDIRECQSPRTCEVKNPPASFHLKGQFCGKCYMLPDPRVSAFKYLGEFSLPAEDPERIERAQEVWERANVDETELLSLSIPLLLQEEFQSFKPPMNDVQAAIELLWTLLDSDIWHRITHPELPQPTKAQRELVLQLRSVLEACRTEAMATEMLHTMAKEQLRQKMMRERMNLLTTRIVNVDVDPKFPACCTCEKHFRVSEEGEGEQPVLIRRCGHVFGETCLRKWFSEHKGCPLCSIVILSKGDILRLRAAEAELEEKYELNLVEAEFDADMLGTPDWLQTLMGCDPEEFLTMFPVEDDGDSDWEDHLLLNEASNWSFPPLFQALLTLSD